MFFDPPYVLLFFGLFASITSGLAFEATLKEKMNAWKQSRSTQNLVQLKSLQLQMPFAGITLGVIFFLTGGLAVFGFPPGASVLVALPLTVGSSYLIWYQLGKVLDQIAQGGSQAIDLDA